MKKAKWFSLPPIPTLLTTAAAAVLLYLVFTRETGAFLRYFSYLFSSCALVVLISGMVRFFRSVGELAKNSGLIRKLQANDHAARYLDDAFFRTQINLYLGTAANVLYIFVKFFSGVVLHSGWLIAFAVYYVALTGLRVSLVLYVRRNEWKNDMRAEYRRYRLVGLLMLGYNMVLVGILSRMIGHDEAYTYPGILIYAIAAYTFYAVILAIVSMARLRRRGSPVVSAVKAVNLAAAIVSMLSLEAAMLLHFGEEGDAVFRHAMLGISGLVIFLFLLGMSAYMIINSSIKLKQLGDSEHE